MPLRVSRFLRMLAAVAVSLGASGLHAQTQFAQPKVMPTAVWPHTFYAGDFDGDGKKDLLYLQYRANALSTQTDTDVYIAYGDGAGGFSAPVPQGSINSRGTMTTSVADVDGDGISDLIFVLGPIPPGYDAVCEVWFGTRQRTIRNSPVEAWVPPFSKAPIYSGSLPVNLGLANTLGLVTQDSANEAAVVMRNDGSGKLLPTYTIPLPDGVGPMAAYDLNGDGNQDLVMLGLSGHTVDVFLGLGSNPIYPTATRYPLPVGAQGMMLVDVDNDSHPDLVIEGANGRFDIYHGNADGTFSTQSEGGSGTLDGTTGNGGHLIGITTLANGTRHNFITATPAGVSVLVGQGNLTYVLKGVYNAGPGRSSYALADFNGDGNLDLAVDSPEGIAILYGNADGSFQTGKAFPTPLPASSGALGAFTNSGNLDAVAGLSSTEFEVLLGQGDGTFVPVGGVNSPTRNGSSGPPAPSYVWSTVGVGDFNGDGLLDVATVYDGPSGQSTVTPWRVAVRVLLNSGLNDGRLSSTPYDIGAFGGQGQPYATGVTGHFLGNGYSGIANLNLQDLLVTLYSGLYSFPLSLIYADFTDAIGVAYNSDLHAHNLTVAGDLNHDGADDLVVQHNGLLSVYLSTKDGQFKKVATTVPVAPYVSSIWGGVSQTYNEPAFPGSMAIADLNGDGFGDLVVAYDDLGADHTQPTASRPNHILVWLGNGDGTFKGPTIIVPSRNFYQIALADLNGDGHPDLVMHDGYVLSVQYGKGDGSFGAEQHYLAGMGLNTISAGDVNHDGKVDLVVANGGTFFGNPVANHEAPVPNPDVNSGGVTVLLNAQAQATVTGTLAAAPNPVAYQAAYSLTATLSTPGVNGTVTFSVDGVAVGTATLANGVGTLAVPANTTSTALTPGAHALTADYSGHNTLTGLAVTGTLIGTMTVSLAPTSVTLTPTTPLQVYYGQGIDGTFAITASFPVTGTYTVLDNGVAVPICTNLPVSINGVPDNCPYGNPVLVDAGPHTLSVAYNGDSQNAPSVSASIPYVVVPDLTTARLTNAPNPSTLGQTVTFTAALTGNYAVPTGVVTFYDAGTAMGTGTLNAGGLATFATSALSVGTHAISASYAGTLDFNAATPNAVSQQVNPPTTPLATAIQLTSSLNPAPAGFSVTFTATVNTSGSFPVVPTGVVSFLDGGVAIGTGALNNLGVATFTTSVLKVGSHAMTASYAGATGSSTGLPPPSPPKPPVRPYAAHASAAAASAKDSPTLLASVSPVLTEVITTPMTTLPPSFSVSVTPDPVYVPAGQDAVLAVRVLVQGNFTQTIQLGCSGLPTEASCVFVNPTIGSAGGTTTLYVLPQGPHGCGANGAPYYGLVGLFGLLFVRRRRRVGLLLGVVCLLGLVGLSGCGSGNCTDLGVIPGNYNFTVTGTPSTGAVTGVQGWIVGMKVTLP